jgi:protein-tyrosine phosphatase
VITSAENFKDRFSILTVCTGNICRSPLAEHLFREGLKRWTVVDVASAGTSALVGESMTVETIAIARDHGVQAPEQHRARQLATEQLRRANLVVALTRAHRSEIVPMLPRGSRHTFTLRELARLLDSVQPSDLRTIAVLPIEDTVGRLAELVDVAAAMRGHVAPPERETDYDVVDPYRRGDAVYQQATAQLVPAVRTVLRHFELAATLTPGGLGE